jgi:hypothetical protein
MSATAQRIVAWLREEFDHEDVASAIEDHFCRLDDEDHSDDGLMDRRGDPEPPIFPGVGAASVEQARAECQNCGHTKGWHDREGCGFAGDCTCGAFAVPCPDPNCNEGIAGPDDQRCARCDGEGFVRAADGAQDECEACYEDRARTARAAAQTTYGDACRWCGHNHDPEDDRCDAHANVGMGRCTCPGEGLAVAYDKINAALYVAEQDCAELRGELAEAVAERDSLQREVERKDRALRTILMSAEGQVTQYARARGLVERTARDALSELGATAPD